MRVTEVLRRRGGLHRSERAMAWIATAVIALASTAVVVRPRPEATAAEPYTLQLSSSALRTSPAPVSGQSVSGDAYVFSSPATGVKRVRFYLDDPDRTGPARQTENVAPYDFAGTNADDTAKPFDTASVADGEHTITAAVERTDGVTDVLHGTITVANTQPALDFVPDGADFDAQQGEAPAPRSVDLVSNDGSAAAFTLNEAATWLEVSPVSGSTPATISVSVDATGLGPGTYTADVTASATGYVSDVLPVTLRVSQYGIRLSLQPDRSADVALEGASADGDVYVFTSPETGVKRVRFWLDDPMRSGSPRQTENVAPYDFAGTNTDDAAEPFDTTTLGNGEHTVSAAVERTDGQTDLLHSMFATTGGEDPVSRPPDQIHLSWTQDPSTTLTVVWRTLDTSVASVVDYRQAGAETWLQAPGALRSSGTEGTLHETTIAGLAPGTAYEYRVPGDAGAWSAIHTAETAPAPGPADFEAVFFADTGLIGRADGLATGTEQVRDEIAALDPLLVLAGGDYAYFDTDTRYGTLDATIDQWFDQSQPFAATEPVMPTYGNHEVLLGEGFEPWAARFATPEGFDGRRNYSFDVGDVHFVSILAVAETTGLSAPTLGWIEQDIQSAQAAGQRWIVPYLHVPPFSDGGNHSSNEALRAQLGPLFESLGVQLVLTAHDQSYERTYPLTDVPATNTPTSTHPNCYTSADGVTYAKIGPGGKLSNRNGDFSQWQTEPPPHWTGARNNTLHHYAALRVSADGELRLDVHGVAGDGSAPVLVDSFRYTTGACQPSLAFSKASVALEADPGSTASDTVTLSSSDGSAASFSVSDDAPWLTASPATGATPAGLTLDADSAGLAAGTYTATVTATAPGYDAATLPVTFTVRSGECDGVPCAEILVDLPYVLDFSTDHGYLGDRTGTGTGFTYVDPPTNGTGYIPANIHADNPLGVLRVSTTSGLAYKASNSQDNALGVGVDPRDQVTVVSATVVDPPAGSSRFEQAGVWFGNDEDDYVKVDVLSAESGTVIESVMEVNGQEAAKKRSGIMILTEAAIELVLRANPVDRTIRTSYAVDGGEPVDLGTYTAPEEFFSFDAARIDPRVGTDTFTGIFASHRNATTSQTYVFGGFAVRGEALPPPTAAGNFAFTRKSFPVASPTAMVWGPDGRLYVTELYGAIHAITFDAQRNVVADQVITTLGSRLTLGITVDPASTPENVILWVSHSHPAISNAPANSSMVSKLSGPGFATREDVITGLPRSKANHSINSLHFGLDGRLYIASGGNTGAGAPNDADTEFGTMEEQPLSAAMIVGDVYAAGFDGSCDNTADIFGPPPCDVIPWATGLRNIYDFVFHSNGNMYGPDNGLGVTGTYPPSPTPPCLGSGDTRSYTEGGHNPGPQPDWLFRVQQGKYYGHPNPHRDECVFNDGSYQGVEPLPNYVAGMTNLGDHASANGTIEYTAGRFGGSLQGTLLITRYAVGDDVLLVRLSPDGQTVLSQGQLAGGFNDPLPIVQDPDGVIYVGEFGAGRVSVLIPDDDPGSWTPEEPMPEAILDAGGTALGGNVYSVAGKNAAGHVSSVRVYDPITGLWAAAADLPGPPVENPAVAALNGKLYSFGGSTDPFSGAVSNAAVYDPVADAWTPLASMPTARAGAAVQVLNGRIYVAGGMDATGASVATVETYDPATDSWSVASSMSTRRDNPGSAVLGGNLYIFGGRTRNADGSGTFELASVESYDPLANAWTARAPMPTGRRTMVVGTLNGRAQVMGGERRSDGMAFDANEEYNPVTNTWRTLAPMPTGRHGAAAATIDGVVYVAGGGPVAGSSFTDITEAFRFG